MKYMIKLLVENISNENLKLKLIEISDNEDLTLDNILDTINKEENYDQLLISLEDLSKCSKTFKNLYVRVKNNPLTMKTKSKSVLDNLQKAMLLSYFYDKSLKHQLIIEKPMAIILDNYSVHHALPFTKLCNFLNMDLIYLPPYSPKYNPIEQVWRTIKATNSRKFISSIELLKHSFEKEFYNVVDNESYWKNWEKKFLIHL